jgi:hypothetical protein
VEKLGVRGRETLTVQYFEFTEHVDEATEHREHVCSIAMRATELHADSLDKSGSNTAAITHYNTTYKTAIRNISIISSSRTIEA